MNPDLDALARRLAVDEFREHQEQAIHAAADGADVLLVAPTGSGKSLAFWAAGLHAGGLTLVVSPLRSLIADQQRRLAELEIPCFTWNSDVKDKKKAEILEQLNAGWHGFFYTTPESLKGKELSFTLTRRVTLAVVDEADCVLADRGFRIQYAWLGRTLSRIQPHRRFACTATLPRADRDHLARSLHLRNPIEITLPVSRENLQIRIRPHGPETLHGILDRHHANRDSGLIFTATVRTAGELHETLRRQGYAAALYHGQLNAKEKTRQQTAFMTGTAPIGVATDAFLRGLDKPDIRFIVHYDHPASIEHWLQGFGRAGRDGKPASVYGLFTGNNQGRATREFLLQSTFPTVDELTLVHEYLSSAPFRDESAASIGEHCLGPRGKFTGAACLNALQRHNLCDAEINPRDRRRRIYHGRGNPKLVDWSHYHAERKRTLDRFAQLCHLVTQPDDEIPHAIDAYFGDDPASVNTRCPF